MLAIRSAMARPIAWGIPIIVPGPRLTVTRCASRSEGAAAAERAAAEAKAASDKADRIFRRGLRK